MILPSVVWEEPPQPPVRGGGRHGRWEAVVQALRARPGRWARVAVYEQATSLAPSASVLSSFDPGLEVVVAGLSLYARFRTRGHLARATR